MEEPLVRKAYYSIGDVCDLTGLKPHVLRYWETQFEVLHPTKNRAGNRVFRPKEIELVLLVKHLLYEKKFTIDGARQKLLEMRQRGEVAEVGKDLLDKEFLTSIRIDLDQLREVGVRRVSIGGALSRLALGSFLEAATAMRDGRFDFVSEIPAISVLQEAFSDREHAAL